MTPEMLQACQPLAEYVLLNGLLWGFAGGLLFACLIFVVVVGT